MKPTDTGYIGDPEPWVHRWPNDPKGVRTDTEKCIVDGCKATREPRSLEDLNKQPIVYPLQQMWRGFKDWRERSWR